MKITKAIPLFPMQRGMDYTSLPGTQHPTALRVSKNIVHRNNSGLKKAPGMRKIPYIGNTDGLQAAVHFFSTKEGNQIDEIVQVRKGRVEVIRNGNVHDMGISVSPSDVVTFERCNNALIIHFENTEPYKYLAGSSTISALGILSTHVDAPPTFSRRHHFRLWLGGRPNFPHRLTVSQVDNIEQYDLANGGYQIRVNEGDGDPLGVTGLSRTYRRNLYAYKYQSIYEIYKTDYGYGIDPVIEEELGCVHHNTIVSTPGDVVHVSPYGIHSLNGLLFGQQVDAHILSLPIYEWFQENVNWSSAKNMKATYDPLSNTYLLSFASRISASNDRVLALNLKTGQFSLWEDVEIPIVGRYFEAGRPRTLVGVENKGLGYLDENLTTRFDDAINVRFKTGPIFPVDDRKSDLSFTRAFVIFRPTLRHQQASFDFSYYLDGKLVDTKTVETHGEPIGETIGSVKIGTDKIRHNRRELASQEIELKGNGTSIEFEVSQTPGVNHKSQDFEFFGIIYEFEYNEDKGSKTAV